MARPLRSRLLLAGLVAALGAGCDSSHSVVHLDAGQPPTEQCTRVARLLEARTACRQDDQCPCGAHCVRGLCAHDCLTDADCAGWCDYTGRCREAADQATVPEVQSVTEHVLRVHPAHLPLYTRTAEPEITITAPRAALGTLRLEASKGLLVRCHDAYAAECELDGLAAGGSVGIKVKVDDADAATSAWQLTIFHGQQMKTVSVEAFAPPQVGVVESGVYRGTVWTETSTMTTLGSEPLSAQTVAHDGPLTTLPIEARVFGDGSLILRDARGVFPGVWRFEIMLDGRFTGFIGGADVSRRVYLGGASDPTERTAAEVAIAARGTLAMAGVGVATGTLVTTLGGLGLGYSPDDGIDERPSITWGLALTRVSAIPDGELPGDHVPTDPTPVFDETADRYGDRLPWDATLAGVALDDDANPGFPSWPERMQYFLCYHHDAGAPTEPTSKPFGATVKTRLLDYACAGEAPARDDELPALPFFSLDLTMTAGTLLGYCLDDLALTSAPPPTASCGPNDINCLTGVSQPRTCIDPPLVLRALGIGLEQLERRDWPQLAYHESKSDAALRLAHRLLQQWLQLHTFVAREASQANDLVFQTSPPDLVKALSVSLDGWRVVLHPKVAGRLAHWPAALLRDPDYRVGQTAVSLDSPQRLGVPVLMLEALAAQADAATQLVGETRFTVRTRLPDEVARTMRAVVVVVPLARLMYRRAAADGAPPWEQLWQDAERRLADALARLQTEWEALEQGANPLGIEDVDLPLYHSGQDASDAIGRFKAMSNYLLAPGGGATDPGWATRAVDDAIASAGAAQAEWENLLERKLQYATTQQQRADRVAQIKQNYGEKLLTLCGEKMFPTAVAAEDVLDTLAQHPDIDAYNCFMDQSNAACQYDEAELLAKLTADDLAFRMCVLGALQQQFAGKVKFKDDFANDFVSQATAAVSKTVQGVELWDAATLGLYNLGENIVTALQAEEIDPRGIIVDGRLTLRTKNPYDLQQAERMCQALFPKAVPMNKRMATLESSPLDRPECYHGSMGELALAVRAAAKDIEIANARLQELSDKYQIALNHCIMQESALSQQQVVSDYAGQITAAWGKLKAAADGIFRIYDGAIGCVCGSGIDTITGCINSGLKLLGDGAKDPLTRALPIGEVQSLNAAFMAQIKDQMTNAACFNDAEMYLVGADTQARQIEKSRLDLSLAMVKLRNAQDTMPRLVAEGTSRVAAEGQRPITSLVNDTWNDLWDLELSTYKRAVENARRDLHVARRATYLAVRAVEYEWQMSLTARGDVLRAAHPSLLEDVLDGLRTALAPNNIAGQTPKNANVVLSLKEQLLQLATMKDWPAGQPTWSDRDRLRLLLTSPRFASFDKAGAYQGQLVPLAIAPLGVLGLGESGGIPILAGADCAERIWKVNLVLQGDNLVDSGTTKTRVDLLQRNVFHSQWCTDPGAGTSPLQSLSVRPSRNLFQDPIWGRVDGTGGTAGEADEFVRASIDAYHGISRTDFEKEAYAQGASLELACRGLYGDFALFFSKEILAVDGHGGLHLENLDDILIRFDYVSVTKSW